MADTEVPNISILVIGDSGTGKTRFASTFPDPFFFDTDKGTVGLKRLGVKFDAEVFKDALHKGKPMVSEGIYPYGESWTMFLEKINQIGESIDKGECKYKTLVLDSATTLSNSALKYVLKSDGKSGKQPFIQHWGAQTALLETVFDQLTSWPGIKIVTAHVQRNTNDLTEVIEMLPLMTGTLAGKMAVYFDEVYYTQVDSKKQGDKVERTYKLLTQSTAMFKQAKSRHEVPDGSLQSWDAIKKYLT